MGNPVKLRTLNHADDGINAAAVDSEEGGGLVNNKVKSASKNSAIKDHKKGKNLVTKNAVKMLSFPSAVDKDGQGHYIHFKIHEHKNAKVHSTKKPGFGTVIEGSEKNQKLMKKRGDTQAGQRSYYASVAPPRRQLATSIALYMPASLSVSYGAGYSDSDIGLGTEAAIAGVQEAANTKGHLGKKIWEGAKAAGNTLSGGVAKVASDIGEGIGLTGISAMLQIGTGTVSTDRVELTFSRMSRREFSYSFTLIPQSGQEAKTIQEIVYLFKMHMHPEYTTGYGDTGHITDKAVKAAIAKATKTKTKSGRFFRIPDTFDIEYMSYENKNTYIHDISTCFLKSMSVTYGGDKFRAYDIQEGMFGDGAPAQTTVISLTFGEIDVLTKSSIAQGF